MSQLQIANSVAKVISLTQKWSGLSTQTDRQAFFQPAHPTELSPAEVGVNDQQLELLIEALRVARQKNLRICVFGDYDADGLCATAIMWEVLHQIGLQATPYIPDRHQDGYGLSITSAQRIVAELHPDLVITVDNGIVAGSAVQWLQTQGVQTIITDHHQPPPKDSPETVTQAIAVVHTTQLSGAGLSWLVARVLWQSFALSLDAEPDLGLAALATIADQVPLRHANRSVVWHGLRSLQQTHRPGILALAKQADFEVAQLSVDQVSYGLVPRLNAMGRLSHAIEALRLLCTKDAKRATLLATKLAQTNTQRQQLTSQLYELAKTQVVDQLAAQSAILIVSGAEFHEGIIGLVASRLTEEHGLPSIVISLNQNYGKGSARSIKGIDITKLLRRHQSLLLELGGHPLAAGFKLEVKNLDLLRQQLLKATAKLSKQPKSHLPPDLVCQVPLSVLTLELAELLEQWQPFGTENPRPLYLIAQAELQDMKYIGSESKHLLLTLHQPDSQTKLQVLCWHKYQHQPWVIGNLYQVAVSISLDTWRGRSRPKIEVVWYTLLKPQSAY